MKTRCSWPGSDEPMIKYHDEEWGVELHDDQKLFEYLVLDTFQAGLSWKIILHRREGFKRAFANFNVARVAEFTDADTERLMQDTGIIRNRQKIASTIQNARLFMETQKEFGSFDRYIWQFVDYAPVINHSKKESNIATTSPEAERLSNDLRSRGFKFIGPTICYAFMQGAGLVNDHLVSCFRHPDQKIERSSAASR